MQPITPVLVETAPAVCGHVELNDRQFAHALKMGVFVGVPVVYAIVAAIMALAVPGNTALLLAAVWPAIVGGPFFAGFAFVLITEARCQPEAGRAPAARAARAPRRRAPVPRAGLAH